MSKQTPMQITIDEITRIQFLKFVRLQKIGIINMTDIVQGSKLINESEDVYETIMWNYEELEEKFKKEENND